MIGIDFMCIEKRDVEAGDFIGSLPISVAATVDGFRELGYKDEICLFTGFYAVDFLRSKYPDLIVKSAEWGGAEAIL